MRTEKMSQLREAVRNLAQQDSDGTVSNQLLYRAVGATAEDEKDRVRRRINGLVQTGELIRIGRGWYRYNPKAAPSRQAELLTRIWRTVKTAKPNWSFQQITRVSGASYSHVVKYVQHLEKAGYVARCGKDGNTVLYRTTARALNQKHTYQPPRPLPDPFASEKENVHELVSLFMLRDLYQPVVRKRVVASCQAILARFERDETDTIETDREESNV